MKKYYCPKCKKFKNRFQLKLKDDTRSYWLECRWCHEQVKLTEEVLLEVIMNVEGDNNEQEANEIQLNMGNTEDIVNKVGVSLLVGNALIKKYHK
jgi:hypothetical protein